MEYKFKIGDKVRIVKGGSGCHPEVDVNKITYISEYGNYGEHPGYKVEPKFGNSKTGAMKGFIDECSFELETREEINIADNALLEIGDLVTDIQKPYENVYILTSVDDFYYNSILIISKYDCDKIGRKITLSPSKIEKIKDLKLSLKIITDEL